MTRRHIRDSARACRDGASRLRAQSRHACGARAPRALGQVGAAPRSRSSGVPAHWLLAHPCLVLRA
jgi:hypothetical protein